MCASALVWWAAPFAYNGWAERGLVLYALFIYVLLPLLSVLLPYFGGTRGLHPMAACFPLGLALLLSPCADLPGLAILCMVLSLVACVAGNEVKKRKELFPGGGKKK